MALQKAFFALPPLTASLLALQGLARPEEHSKALALWCLGPWRCLKTALWRLEFFLKLRPLRAQVHTWSSEELRTHWRRREDDVVVATPPKSGTTLLLQVAHQLRVHGAGLLFVAVASLAGGRWGGDMDFEDQMDVAPCLEGVKSSVSSSFRASNRLVSGGAAGLLVNDINAEQVANPRLYKSHLRFKCCPAVKRIYCYRDLKEPRKPPQ